MLGRFACGALAMCALAAAVPASARAASHTIDIRAQPLSSALEDLARQTGVELLFDRSLVSGRQAPHVHGAYDFQAALEQLLSGTGLTFRRAESGAWLILRGPAVPPPQELAAPEILVIGHRTQNFDIRRRRDDIQPYDVASAASIVSSHTDNVDDYFRARVTANTEFVSPTLLTTGATNSEIDLRGLGADSTLVLIDGRRLPGIPSDRLAFSQPDLNAIPIHAIDRIETLTGTAGGIFGFGALGGAVNVILKRDYRGAELNVTSGISSRGDARHLAIEGRVGFTPDHGRTDVMLYLSHEWSQPLLVGQRDFTSRNLKETNRRAGDLFGIVFPTADSISIDGFGSNLVFKPQFGGGALPSDHTFLPTGFSGNPSDLVAALTEHEGQTDLSLSPGSRQSQIHSNPDVSAAIVNLRHRFSEAVEVYFDGLLFRDHGQYVLNRPDFGGLLLLDATSPINPFNQFVLLEFPEPGKTDSRINVDSQRYTAGVIAKLPLHWRGTVEATFGAAHYDKVQSLLLTNLPFGSNLNPFGNWADFQQALTQFSGNIRVSEHRPNHYQEQLLQLAGPLFRTTAGPATLTVSVERHREKAGASVERQTSDVFGSSSSMAPPHSSTTKSIHAELNSKIFDETAPFFLIKRLTLQLAIHFDSQKVVFSTDPTKPKDTLFHTTFTGLAYTAGAKVQPLSWLALRGSFATGRQAPPLAAMITRFVDSSYVAATRDPKRGNSFLEAEGPFPVKAEGNPNLSTLRASTMSVGVVVSPLEQKDLRFSLDYSRIRKTRDVQHLFNAQVILDHEADFPGRVTRAPLTAQDMALGYTGGLITALDVTNINGRSVRVDTLDGRLDWSFPFFTGGLHLYGSATWQMHNVQHDLFQQPVEQVNFLAGPLKWRANGGVDWTRGLLTVGANLQYFGRYRVFPPGPNASQDLFKTIQGSACVPSQTYLDLYATRRIVLGGPASRRFLNIDLGINNVLDSSPPREANFLFGDPGYSRYGDPRRRRFELALTAGL